MAITKDTVNVFLSTFPGLSLPRTLCLPLSSKSSCAELLSLTKSLLPSNVVPTIFVTTQDGRKIRDASDITLADLAQSWDGENAVPLSFIDLRLCVPLVGGKGGFGSQLRAAGGRMSSRKRKQNAELATGSARNLDGRRLRTITEAKNLATYLATKPEMDRKEKEERRKRWEQVIEMAEQREADMRAGKTADGRRKGLSEEWIQEKEDVGDNVKNAVKLAMAAEAESETTKPEGIGSDRSSSESTEGDSGDDDPMELDEEGMLRLRKEAEAGDADAIWVLHNKLKIPASYLPKVKPPQRRFAGFDDDLSSTDDEEVDGKEDDELVGKGKTVHQD